VKSYLEISITANETRRELLIPTMMELGAQGFMETDSELLCYFDKTRWTRRQMENLQHDVAQLLRTISSNARVKLQTIQEKDWNELWERSVQPIEIGEKLVVKPSWARYEKRDRKIIIQIDPKMSFGTGYHETTRLMLRLLEQHLREGSTVLDVGTGTGILAIAAAKLGARQAVGIDNERWAIENALENVKANAVADKIRITGQPLNRLTDASFDLIAANITLNTIIALLPEITRLLKPKGILLFSGLLLQDEETLTRHLKKNDCRLFDRLQEGEWIAMGVNLTPPAAGRAIQK